MCDNGTDDDSDGLVDCEDPDCDGIPPCGMVELEICDNETDDDADGFIDCEDADCEFFPACTTLSCDPIEQTGCTDPDACYLDAQNPDGYCTTAGAVATGERCTATPDCAPGNVCTGQNPQNRVCRQLCLLAGGTTCVAGTCQQSMTLGSDVFGVCR